MELYSRLKIDWIKTGENLANIRMNNLNLRRYVCYFNKKKNEHKVLSLDFRPKYTCFSEYECETCTKEMDQLISVQELANVFGLSRDVINNWETGRTIPDIEDLLLYSKITGLSIEDILISY